MPEQRVNILVYRPDGTLIARYLLGDGEHLIGRDINSAVYLDSEYISSNHAKLHLSHDGIQIEDLNSTSGTFLDGVPVRGKLRIKPGQVLQVADLTVNLQLESEGQIGPGSRLGDGRYTLVRLLGRGGMGEVWLARDEQLQEAVALKKIPHEVAADANALADMRREVQKSRILSHPNIIRIHDLYIKAGEDPLITLEYVDGNDLTAIAATKTNGIFGWGEIKDWIVQLSGALEYAHSEKIVHRDLKPANIMITRSGRLKLADFGIAATIVDSIGRSSVKDFVMGTPLYMSPQQMEGATPKATDDVYAFGATLCELLTSKPPFYTGNVEHQVLNVTPTPVVQRLQEFGFTNEIPEYVNTLVMACLAKDPDGRPQSMAAIQEWIQSEGEAKEIIPRPSTKTVKKMAVSAGGRTLTYVTGVVAAVLIIGLGIWFAGQGEGLSGDQLQLAEAEKAAAKIKNLLERGDWKWVLEINPTNSEALQLKAAAAKAAAAKTAAAKTAAAKTAAAKTAAAKTAAAAKKHERWLWEFETGDKVTSSPAIGFDETVYIGSWDNKVYALDGKTGVKKWEFETSGDVTSSPAIGADGTVYVGSGDKKIYALDGKTGREIWEFLTGAGVTSSPAIGADGTVYVGSFDKKIYALDGEKGEVLWEFVTGNYVSSSPAIGADGTVYVGSRDKKVYALDGKTGTKQWEFETGKLVTSSPAIGADGTIYVGSYDFKIYALDGKTGAHLWEFVTNGGVTSSPAIGADGTIYIGSDDYNIYALDGKTGREKWKFPTGSNVTSSPAIGSDGTVYVGSEGNKVYALDGENGARLWEYKTEAGVTSSPAIGADGTIYFGSGDGKVYALKTDSKGPANSPWPMRGRNPQHSIQNKK